MTGYSERRLAAEALIEFLRIKIQADEHWAWWLGGNSKSDEDERACFALRLLSDVAAKRRILDLHAPVRLPVSFPRPEMLQCEYCASLCHSRSGLGCDEPIDAPWPCDTVRALASGYSEQPDYREEWRP